MNALPNKIRNDEVEALLKNLKDLGLGAQMDAHVGHANALASLNIAESLQCLQLQLVETGRENRVTLHEITDKLIQSNRILATSNDRHASAMQWLTGALVIIGILQAFIAWKTH